MDRNVIAKSVFKRLGAYVMKDGTIKTTEKTPKVVEKLLLRSTHHPAQREQVGYFVTGLRRYIKSR